MYQAASIALFARYYFQNQKVIPSTFPHIRYVSISSNCYISLVQTQINPFTANVDFCCFTLANASQARNNVAESVKKSINRSCIFFRYHFALVNRGLSGTVSTHYFNFSNWPKEAVFLKCRYFEYTFMWTNRLYMLFGLFIWVISSLWIMPEDFSCKMQCFPVPRNSGKSWEFDETNFKRGKFFLPVKKHY